MTDPLFQRDGDAWLPTEQSGSPWGRGVLHGGPVCGLLARALEEIADPELQAARLSVDLLRPVPMAPLALHATLVRDGRRLAVAEASLSSDGKEAARATSLFLRPEAAPREDPGDPAPPSPETLVTDHLVPPEIRRYVPPGFHREVEVRWVRGEGEARPAGWFRMPMPIVPGESVTAFQRAAALSDFTNALASISGRARPAPGPAYINPDNTLYLSRLPIGEWIFLALERVDALDGIGAVEVALSDEQGRFGRTVQSRLMNRPRRA